MILGMSGATYTFLHVLISLAGIGSGFAVMFGFLTGKRLDGWTAIFLVTIVLTSLTGFLFPVEHILPSHVVGIISLAALAVAIPARYVFHLAGAWRWIYVVGAVLALYLRRRGASVPESACPEGARSDAERAAVPGCSTHRHGALYRSGHSRSEEVPCRAGRYCLIGRISWFS